MHHAVVPLTCVNVFTEAVSSTLQARTILTVQRLFPGLELGSRCLVTSRTLGLCMVTLTVRGEDKCVATSEQTRQIAHSTPTAHADQARRDQKDKGVQCENGLARTAKDIVPRQWKERYEDGCSHEPGQS